jgi:dienelactone hydrolase
VIARAFHAWERRLSEVDPHRFVRPFEWGLDWLGLERPGAGGKPAARLVDYARNAVQDSDAFFSAPPTAEYTRTGDVLTFPSALVTPHEGNNTVVVRIFPADERRHRSRRAVLVLPQWNADPAGHVGLCQLFARFGITALRLSMPYHDSRKPADTPRAEYIVSPNVGRTLHANRQAVLDARRAIDWLAHQGYERIGIVGTSLGSCLSMLTMTHDPRIRVGAFNHVSPYFADVVWQGLSTRHVRAGLDGHVELHTLRDMWMPISPWPFIDRVRGRRVLLVHALYDLTFPVELSRRMLRQFADRGIPFEGATLPCGHYTTGRAPFKFLDGYYLTKFLVRNL